MEYVILIVVLGLFIIGSSFVSSVETAYTSISLIDWKVYLQNKKHQKKQSTKIVNYLLQKYPITVAMALIINNLLAVGAGLFTQYMLETQINLHPVVASSVSLVVVTFLLVLFGDFFPKNFVRYHSIKFGIKTSYLTLLLWTLLYPCAWLFSNLVPKTKQRKISREYIDHLTEVALDDKVFDQHEAQLVSSALELDNKLVRDFMIENPICVQQQGTIHDWLKVYQEHQYTRVVVLDQNDRVFGLLNYKILLGLIFDQNGQLKPLKNIDLQAGIQDVLYIPVDVKLDEALRQMQKFQTHMAVVIPAPGSKDMVGIITIEDILEELVGEIYDENDEDLEIKVINHLIFVINPNASATSVAKTLNLPMSLVVDPKAKARNLFLLFFGKKRLKLNHQYENDQLILKVERDLDTRKYRYYVTKKEVITPQTPTSSLRTLLSRNVKGQ